MLLLGGRAAANPTFQKVAVSGQQATGLTAGITFDSFSLPMINDSGAVAFTCDLKGTTDDSNDESIWTLLTGTLQLTVREGTKALGTPAGTGTYVYGPQLFATGFDSAGNVAFTADLLNTNATDPEQGLWRGTTGAVNAVALAGGTAPFSSTGYTYQAIASDSPVEQINGFTAFAASISNGTIDADGNKILDYGIWKGSPGSVSLVASTVSQPPGIPTGARFASFSALSLNNSGKIAFAASLLDGSGGVTAANDQGIWSDAQGTTLALVVRKGVTAPGTTSTQFAFFGAPQLLTGNRVVFSAQLSGSSVNDTNDTGIWRDSSGGLLLVARTGNQAPGAPTGAVFEILDEPLVSGGAVAFSAQLHVGAGGVTDENQDGIWLSPSGSTTVSLLVREGDPAPGLFGLTVAPDRGSLMLNSLNHIAFTATLTGSGVVTGTNDEALFAQDARGALNLVLRTGDPFLLNPGDFRTVASFEVSTLGAGFTTADSWNDLHQLAFGITFTDGTSGIFLANVPEPASATLLAGAGLVLLARRRRSAG